MTRSGRADGRKLGGAHVSGAGSVETVVVGVIVVVVVSGMMIVVAGVSGSPVVAQAASTNNSIKAVRVRREDTDRSVPDPSCGSRIPGRDLTQWRGGTVNWLYED